MHLFQTFYETTLKSLLKRSTRLFQVSLNAAYFSHKLSPHALPRCYLIHTSIIILGHFLHLLHLCPYLELGLFVLLSFFIFIFMFILTNHIISLIQTHLFFYLFFRICSINFCCNFSLAVLIKVLLIKKRVAT